MASSSLSKVTGTQSRMFGGRRGVVLQLAAALLVTASLFVAIPSCSAAASASITPPKKPGASPPAQPVDVGRRRSSSSIVFPLRGDVYPNGLYYVTMNIGHPPRPYILDVDTGSDLSWLHCDAPCHHCPKCPHPLYRPAKDKLVPCNHPLCGNLPGHRDCGDNPLQCDYEIQYADHCSSLGVLVTDTFTIQLTNNSIARPYLSFGCGYDQQGPGAGRPSPVDGMLGLGSGSASFVSQLQAQGITRGIVGHCLGRKGTGYLFFGDAVIPSYGVTWAPMHHQANEEHNYYSPGPASLFLGKQALHVDALQLAFDSGSSYTYFANKPYQTFLSALRHHLSTTPLKETQDKDLPICWKGPKPFRSVIDAGYYFRPLVLDFANTKGAHLEIPPENYLVITKLHNACLGILNGTQVGLQDLSVIGDISMQDLMVIYDNEKQQVGWARASCDRPRLPNAHEHDEGFEEGLCQPQSTIIGAITQEYPAYYG